jgi:GDP-L-fucose synthase
MREFLFVDDMANACIHMMVNFSPTDDQNKQGDIFMNIGTGKDITIKALAEIVQKIV